MVLQVFRAHYYVNASEFQKARRLLVPLESPGFDPPISRLKSTILLARCYGQLGEPGMQREALLRALTANPQDVQAKLGLIDRMVKEGSSTKRSTNTRTRQA